MKIRTYLVALAALAFGSTARADEGMWLLQLMKQQNSIELMKKQGLKLEADDLYNPNGVSLKDAVGIFGGGCTGEIISPEGLILTNHHCGYASIQQHSSVEHDYLTDGFWAKNRGEELPTPGLKFQFVDRIEDITDIVNQKIATGEVTEVNALTRPFLNKLAKELFEKSDLKGKKGIEVQALPFYAGNKFYLFYKKVYTDVRMVAAPPSSVGKFGGETDNWMWPRHTGDFSMFRIYADANGDPAEYAASNVPLKTPKYLPISIKGLEEGDYAMIMGFPGSTSRYLTVSEVKERMEAQNQPRITIRGARLAVLKEVMAASDKTRIQYANKYAGSSNYWKNSIGMNKAIIDNDVLGTKAEQEKKFAEFAKGKPEYEGVVEKIDAIVNQTMPVTGQYYYLMEAFSGAIEFGSPYMVMDNLKSDLNVMLNAPANFTYYKDTTDFFWSSNNANTGRMDLIVYTFPYTDPNTFTEEYLVAKRDSVLKANLPGSFPGSYMQTETRAGVEYTPITLNGKYCGVMRGLWRMQGDMMGGPFVSHTRLDEKNHRVVVAEGFVYAPETDKRNFMRRIEAALFTLRLPGEFDEPVTETLDIPKEKK